MSETLTEIPPDGYSRCLALAESIISALDDQDVIATYFRLKGKIMQNSGDSTSVTVEPEHAYALYQSILQQNEQIKAEIKLLSQKALDFSNDPENEAVINRLREAQRQILPNYQAPPTGDAIKELELLQKVVEVKIGAFNHVRDTLKAENAKLQNELKELKCSIGAKIMQVHKKEEEEIDRIESEKQRLMEEIQAAEAELRNAQAECESAREENKQLTDKCQETESLIEQLTKEACETKMQIERTEADCERMLEEIEQTKNQLAVKTKEFNSLQALQRYGIQTNDGVEISEEINRMLQKAEALRVENAQMEYEIKRLQKKQIEQPSASRIIDEDELAAQMLRAQFRK